MGGAHRQAPRCLQHVHQAPRRTAVAGIVRPRGVCDLFQPKKPDGAEPDSVRDFISKTILEVDQMPVLKNPRHERFAQFMAEGKTVLMLIS